MRISDWSSDVCSSDLRPAPQNARPRDQGDRRQGDQAAADEPVAVHAAIGWDSGEEGRRRLETVASRKLTRAHRNIRWNEKYCRVPEGRLSSEEPTSELQSLMRISHAVFCLKSIIQASPDPKSKHANYCH